MAERFRSNVQRNAQILGEKLRQISDLVPDRPEFRLVTYNHFFHLKSR